ncbi:hypothetical protein C1752_04351 [Acaryochloris thomasi RCC1774]|uniref:Peptidase C14 caspase domain-containing protein n=1 Tax=Acaryochloris thomasi RCC1774 TaxID=1764569 RepID=A0A2W1JDP8_9CYAN|nr:caspase family protein [Acaryochloris thomasi]PZD71866.1 hypothetical protein C1752_04351 [Acaryochloris thomasi RCC1774]
MALQVEQLVYTSFLETGFKGLAGPQIPAHVQQSFVEAVVHQHWNAYTPPSVGYRAAYLHQLSLQECLFGWLYNDGLDEIGRDGVPYFLCYYLVQELEDWHLNLIFDCLERGPLTIIDRQQIPSALDAVTIPDPCDYVPTRSGVVVPSATRGRCRLQLDKQQCLDFCLPLEPQAGAVAAQLEVSEPLTVEEAELLSPLPAIPMALHDPMPRQTMHKAALLIGVSEYGEGLQALPGTLENVEAMRGVLEHQEQGGFDDVKTLVDPDPQAMAEAIEALFLDRQPEDLVLLYFSGYVSVLEPHEKIGLTTCLSRRGANDNVVRSTVVTADFINDVMGDSQSEHQTLVLDWCIDEGRPPLDTAQRAVKFAPQLQGKRRTVLMSAASTQTAVVPPPSEGSAYTFFLVEGLKTGAADLNCDGSISLGEWHTYAQQRLRQVSPAIDPQISGVQTVAKTTVAVSPTHEPRFKYRKQVEECSQQGRISVENRVVLDTLYKILELSLDEATTIEAEVLKPRQEYYQKRQDYAIAFTEAIQKGYPLTPDLQAQFKQFQRQLGLTDADIVPVESELIRRLDVLKNPGLIGASSLSSQPEGRPTARQRMVRAFDYGRQAIKPFSERMVTAYGLPLVISARHLFARCRQGLAQRPSVGRLSSVKLRRLNPLHLTYLCIGVGVSTVLLVVVINQQQMANRKQRVNSGVPDLERSSAIAESRD